MIPLVTAKGYSKIYNRWIEGYLVVHLPYTPNPVCNDPNVWKEKVDHDTEYYICHDGFSDFDLPRSVVYNQVDKDSIHLYSGMDGKDSVSGSTIHLYEGDKVQDSSKSIIGVIVFCKGSWLVVEGNSKYNLYDYSWVRLSDSVEGVSEYCGT